MAIDGTDVRRITNTTFNESSPSWSPFLTQGISVKYTMDENYTVESGLNDGKQSFTLKIANPEQRILENS